MAGNLLRSVTRIGILLIGFSSFADAQEVVTGHYQPLFAGGLNSGTLPPGPLLVLQNSSMYYAATTFRDGNGNKIKGIDELNIFANRTGALWVTPWKILGANFAVAGGVSVANLAPNPVVIQGETLQTGVGFGDISVAPILLGWQWANLYLRFMDTVFIPSGRFRLGASDNTGKGFWTNMFSLGATYLFPGSRPWHASVTGRYEIHSNQKGRDLRPGDTLTLEFGFGKKLTDKLDMGPVAFIWHQVTNASGADAQDTVKYRLFGAGLEVDYKFRKWFGVKARGAWEFGAENSSEGGVFILELNFPFT